MNTLPEAHIAGVKMRRPPSLVKENALLHPAPSEQFFLIFGSYWRVHGIVFPF